MSALNNGPDDCKAVMRVGQNLYSTPTAHRPILQFKGTDDAVFSAEGVSSVPLGGGSNLLYAGQSKFFDVTVRIDPLQNPVHAGNLARITAKAQAFAPNGTYIGQFSAPSSTGPQKRALDVCVVPTGETSLATGLWAFDSIAAYRARLTPATPEWGAGSVPTWMVDEWDPGSGKDFCYLDYADPSVCAEWAGLVDVIPGNWEVFPSAVAGYPNEWGYLLPSSVPQEWDGVGYAFGCIQHYTRALSRRGPGATCHAAHEQYMVMDCRDHGTDPDGELPHPSWWVLYKQQVLGQVITYAGPSGGLLEVDVQSIRGGVSQTTSFLVSP